MSRKHKEPPESLTYPENHHYQSPPESLTSYISVNWLEFKKWLVNPTTFPPVYVINLPESQQKIRLKGIRLKPDYVEARCNLGSAHLTQGRIDDAIVDFTQVLQRRPDFVPAQRGLLKARQLQAK